MRIGTSMSTKRLDQACVDEYKIPLSEFNNSSETPTLPPLFVEFIGTK